MVPGFEMRVSDAERDATAAQLREHFASGRLTQDELNERLDQTFAARTRGDLSRVMTDLPPAGAAGAAFGGTPRREFGARGYGPGGASDGWGRGAGRAAAPVLTSFVLLSALLLLGMLGVFGLGAGRPFGFVLLFAAFALLRRLLFAIFGRRRGRGRGSRGGPRRRC